MGQSERCCGRGALEDSYSDEEAQEDLPEDSHENGSCSTTSEPQDDSKAVAIIKSVGELSVLEKSKYTHQIRVSVTHLSLATLFG